MQAPTVNELLNDTGVRQALEDAWQASLPGDPPAGMRRVAGFLWIWRREPLRPSVPEPVGGPCLT
jgi:hypothetical protein